MVRIDAVRGRYIFIFTACIIAGVAQGLLLPLLAQILENRGVSSSVNGLQSSFLYLGTILASPFMAAPVRRFGYKPVITVGITMVAVGYILFPIFDDLMVWYALRLLIGVGLAALHFSSQLWVQSTTPPEHRGKTITLYGMCYGIGFGVGPLGINLLQFGLWVPFFIFATVLAFLLVVVMMLGNDRPEEQAEDSKESRNYYRTWKIAYLGLIPAVLYGFMEAGLVSTFPVVGNRMGISPSIVAMCLFVFVIGSIILQLPLGWMSDRWGRKPVIFTVTATGGALFLVIPWTFDHPYLLIGLFALTGSLVGSIFSLGMVLATDLLPKHLLPNSGVIVSVGFGVASMASPNLIGMSIQFVSPPSLFYILGGTFLGYAVLLGLKGNKEKTVELN